MDGELEQLGERIAEQAAHVWTMLDHAATHLAREAEPPASDDSAESPAREVAVRPAQGDAAPGGRDDSAESPVVTPPSGAAASASRPDATVRGSHDSAESREASHAPGLYTD